MNLFEHIAIAGISLAVGAGLIAVASEASSLAGSHSQLVEQMAEPSLQHEAIMKAEAMNRQMKAQAESEALLKQHQSQAKG